MSNTYCIRITYDLLTKSYIECVKWLLTKFTPKKYFIVTEYGTLTGKYHLQCFVDFGETSVNTFRTEIQKYVNQFKEKKDDNKDGKKKKKTAKGGNAFYSCKKADSELPIDYLSYLTKEDEKPIHNFTQEELDQVLERQEQYLQDRKKQREEKQPAWKRFIIEHEDYLKSSTSYVLYEQLPGMYIDWELENNKQENEFQTIRNIRTILLRYSEKFKSEYKEHIRDKVLICK